MNSAVNWFEIPVSDLNRAVTFYETILGSRLQRGVFGGIDTAVFPYDNPGIGGALIQDPRRTPRAEGTLIYLNCEGHLEEVIGRVAAAGGEVVLPKTAIGEPGFISIVQDPEGNRVGLHSCTAANADRGTLSAGR